MKPFFFLAYFLYSSISLAQCDDFDAEYTLYHPTCNGYTDGAITAIVSGGELPFIYNMFNEDGDEVTMIMGGTEFILGFGCYFIEITDADGCVILDTLKLIDPDLMTVEISITPPTDTELCDGIISCDTVYDYQGDFELMSYYWMPLAVGGVGENTVTDICAGDYVLTVNDENGCSVFFDIEVIAFAGINDLKQKPISVFVNSISGELIITDIANDNEFVRLVSVSGQMMMQSELEIGENRLQFNLESGIYLYQLVSEGKITQTGKFKL